MEAIMVVAAVSVVEKVQVQVAVMVVWRTARVTGTLLRELTPDKELVDLVVPS
jgi:hypothetical protein